MKKRIRSVFLHAVKMVGRTLKSYTLLSVTIILTFSLFLGYLFYTDSAAYNEYKEIFATRREMLYIQDADMNNDKLNLFLLKAEDLASYHISYVYTTPAGTLNSNYILEKDKGLEDPPIIRLPNWQVAFIPTGAWVGDIFSSWYPYDLSCITWLDGKERSGVTLAKDEAILPEQLYYALGLDQMEKPEYIFRFDEYSDCGAMTLKIVGLLEDKQTLSGTLAAESETGSYTNRILVSQESMPAIRDVSQWGRRIYVYTKSPELITELAKSLDYPVHAVYERQNEALAQLRYRMGNKALIAAALLLLLGINLYSCFSNVLNDRKFEIGVKRALGASAWSIVRQFVYESLMVVLANIAISVALVTNIFIVMKFINERIPDELGELHQWTVYISPYSVGMFLVCAVALTVVFSLIFAYQSTRVEIVKYLKAE